MEQIGGRVGLPAVDGQWFGSGVNRAGESLLNILDHRGPWNCVQCSFIWRPNSGVLLGSMRWSLRSRT